MRASVLFLTVAAVLTACATNPGAAPYTTMSPAGLRTGVIVSAAECGREPSAVWVTAPHADGVVEGACIRYYAAGLAATNPVAIVFLHGNRLARSFDKEGRLIRVDAGSSYGAPSVAEMQTAAGLQAKALGHPFIIVARPGYYGSSGVANDQYRRREILLVNAALDAIKQRHGIARFGVSSQSGGGPALAGLLAMRSDIPCAAFSSSLTAFDEREQALREPSRNPPLRQVTPDAYDPIRETTNIRPAADRRVFIVGDPNDKLIPLAAQQAYADALKRQGVHVAMTASTAVGDNHHSLGATGQRAVGWCLDGVSDAEILTRMGKGEAAYKLEGGFY
ncbi:MAG TPA: hypothetical protein VHT71_10845 [Methylomirabilota bacterium]|jgi:hypothetical protein|nr:hypothetical protein [Methylomirabilota bacterium]